MDIARKTSTKYIDLPNHGFPATKQRKWLATVNEAYSKIGLTQEVRFLASVTQEFRFLASVTAALAAYSAIFFTYKNGKVFLE
jgi:hypothetical protein